MCAHPSVHVRVWDTRRKMEFGVFLGRTYVLHGFLLVIEFMV